MLRAIESFHQDRLGDWVADLGCGHGQHVRHKPPFWTRPWVLSPEGRASRVGVELECVRCDRFELPEGFVPYKRTAEFAAHSIPGGLLKHHSTKHGIWGVIHVAVGRLLYVVEHPLACEFALDVATRGIVVPEVLHRVAPDGDVRFFVEFYHKPA